LSAALNGIEAYPLEVEVNAGWGDMIVIVGLPAAVVKESLDRVTTALNNSGFKFPKTYRAFCEGCVQVYRGCGEGVLHGPPFDAFVQIAKSLSWAWASSKIEL
jgi:hypothetical protein